MSVVVMEFVDPVLVLEAEDFLRRLLELMLMLLVLRLFLSRLKVVLCKKRGKK
jgi:hypothetical protein